MSRLSRDKEISLSLKIFKLSTIDKAFKPM